MASMRRIVSSEKVVGLADLRAKLLVLGERMAKNVLRRGLLAGAGVIRDGAKPKAPKRTGRLKTNVIAETRGVFKGPSGRPAGHRAVVLVRGKDKLGGRSARSYAHFVEFGTKPHRVGKGSIKELWKGSKKRKRQVGAKHPGSKAKPFMRPAFDELKYEAIRVTEQRIREELAKEVAKLSKRKKVA